MTTEKMTADDARTFEKGPSLTHTALLTQAAADRGCTCKPYEDWFTYNRWIAQGFQVQKGEHGIRLSVFVDREVTENGKVKVVSIPKSTSLFCRCQVKPVGETAESTAPIFKADPKPARPQPPTLAERVKALEE